MALTPHATKIIDESFTGTFTTLNGRTPDTTNNSSVWSDGTTAGTRFSGTGTASLATGSNRLASISGGATDLTVEATLNYNSSATVGLDAAIVLALPSALTTITGACYRLDVQPNTTPKFVLKRQTTTLTSSASFTPSNSASFKVRLTCRLNGSSQPQFSAWYDALLGSGWQTLTWADTNTTNTADLDTFTDDSGTPASGNFVGIFASTAVNVIIDDFRVYNDGGGGGGGAVTDDGTGTVWWNKAPTFDQLPSGILVPRHRIIQDHLL